jgi:hypothetical protein
MHLVKDNSIREFWVNLPGSSSYERPPAHYFVAESLDGREYLVNRYFASCFGAFKHDVRRNVNALLFIIGHRAGGIVPSSEDFEERVKLLNWLLSSSESPYRKLFPYIKVHYIGDRKLPGFPNLYSHHIPVAVEVVNTNVDNRSIINFLIAVRTVIQLPHFTKAWNYLFYTGQMTRTEAYWLAWHTNIDLSKLTFSGFGFGAGGDTPFSVVYQSTALVSPEKGKYYIEDYGTSLAKMIDGNIPTTEVKERNFRITQHYIPCNGIWAIIKGLKPIPPLRAELTKDASVKHNLPILLQSLRERLAYERENVK